MKRATFKNYWAGMLMTALITTAWPVEAIKRPETPYDFRNNAVLHAQYAQVYMDRQRYDEAIAEYHIAIRLNPGAAMLAPLYYNLGLAYRKKGEYARALACLQRAVRIQPNFELYYRHLIETYRLAGTLARAQASLERATEWNDRNSEAWFMLGLIREQQGDAAGAQQAFATFLKLEPESRLADAARGRL
jgi:tetratricopeptide (TPR) repeat protein